MTVLPSSVVVVGLGLIGGSLCRSLRVAIPGLQLVGIDTDAATIELAQDSGVCDVVGFSTELLADAEVVVLCSPLDTIPGWVRSCADRVPTALVTDCGSTKAWIMQQARSISGVRFLGGHPMAGREEGGWALSDAGLYDGCTWVLTPADDGDVGDFDPWVAALTAIGAHVTVMTPEAHDNAVAWSSHLPLAVSSALVNAVASSPEWPGAGGLTAGGFRDAVRLAGGDPRLHASIAATNAPALGAAIDALINELTALRGRLTDDEALLEYFVRARESRRHWLADRARRGRPVL